MPQIEYHPKVFKQFKKIPKIEQKKIMRKLEFLAEYPYSGKPLQGDYEGFLSLKAWPYRIIFDISISSDQITKMGILIYSVKHRQGSYKN